MPFLRFFGATPSELPTTLFDSMLFWGFLIGLGVLISSVYRRFMYERDSNTVIRIYTPKLNPMSNIRVDISYLRRVPEMSEPAPFTLDIPVSAAPPVYPQPSRSSSPVQTPSSSPPISTMGMAGGDADTAFVTGISLEAIAPVHDVGNHPGEEEPILRRRAAKDV